MKTVKKIFSLTEKTLEKFQRLMEQDNASNNSELITKLIDKAYNETFGTCENETKISDVENLLRKIIAICNENNQMIYQNRDMLNSLGYFYELQEYISADDKLINGNPHEVIKTALANYKKQIHTKALQKSTAEMLNER